MQGPTAPVTESHKLFLIMESDILDQLSFLAGLPATEQTLFNLDCSASEQLALTSFGTLSPSSDSALSSPTPFFFKTEPVQATPQRRLSVTDVVLSEPQNTMRRLSQESGAPLEHIPLEHMDSRTRRLIKNVSIQMQRVFLVFSLCRSATQYLAHRHRGSRRHCHGSARRSICNNWKIKLLTARRK